jgi:phosphoserine phosphatase
VESGFIATLIASERLTRGDISAAEDALGGAAGHRWIEEGSACDIALACPPDIARTSLDRLFESVDIVVQPAEGRRKRLLVADMDSTMIGQECIDELADYAGLKAEVAAVTERAMLGELDFEAALDARVALLKGLDARVIGHCYDQRVRATPGAAALVRTMAEGGAYCLLVSGGFGLFADRVAADIGFDAAIANHLDLADGRIAGTVAKPIVDAEGKRRALVDAAAARQIPMAETLGVGDGANDVPMLRQAGLGIAYHAKPAAAEAADAEIRANDLTALLYAQGYARAEWVEG